LQDDSVCACYFATTDLRGYRDHENCSICASVQYLTFKLVYTIKRHSVFALYLFVRVKYVQVIDTQRD